MQINLSPMFRILLMVVYCFGFVICSGLGASRVDRPIGVSITKKVFYNPARDFTCLDGSKKISFQYVNDDYCDCRDGSDEPGTSACPNSQFHCTNAGFRPTNIPSSRVNDGICDCCDGSDEWKYEGSCINRCVELWKAEREITKAKEDAQNQGFVLKQAFAKAGLEKKLERETKIEELSEKVKQIAEQESQIQMEKDALEEKEKMLKAVFEKAVAEQKALDEIEEQKNRGIDAFNEMDIDKDGSLSTSEFVFHTELDPDASDETFTLIEAETVLTAEKIELEKFLDVVWSSINSTFATNNFLPPPPEQMPPPPDQLDEENSDEDDEDEGKENLDLVDQADADSEYDDDGEYPDDDDIEDDEVKVKEAEHKADDVIYDEETADMIKLADEARAKLKDVSEQKKRVEAEIADFRKSLAMDFGPDHSYQVMQSQCYVLDTNEYKYKICPFEKTTQSPKRGGTETSLGRWGRWSGPIEDRYSKMQYENGLGCWNGPSRSTEVRLRCGLEHKLLSVDEPSRCTYVFEFATPCACAKVNNQHQRDEL